MNTADAAFSFCLHDLLLELPTQSLFMCFQKLVEKELMFCSNYEGKEGISGV